MTKKELKLLLTEDVDTTLEKLMQIIPSDSPVFDNFIMVLSRHKDLIREYNNGVLTPIEKNIEKSKIRGSVLSVINSLDSLESHNQYKELTELELDDGTNDDDDDLEGEEELGLLETEEIMLSSMEELQSNLSRLTEHINEFGAKIQEDTHNLVTYTKSTQNPNRLIVQRIVNQAALTFNNYAERLKVEVPIFKQHTQLSTKSSLDYIAKLYEFDIKSQVEEISKFHDSIKSLIVTSKESRVSLEMMYVEIKKIPSITSEFIKAKNKVIKILDEFYEYYDNYLNELEKLERNIEGIFNELS